MLGLFSPCSFYSWGSSQLAQQIKTTQSFSVTKMPCLVLVWWPWQIRHELSTWPFWTCVPIIIKVFGSKVIVKICSQTNYSLLYPISVQEIVESGERETEVLMAQTPGVQHLSERMDNPSELYENTAWIASTGNFIAYLEMRAIVFSGVGIMGSLKPLQRVSTSYYCTQPHYLRFPKVVSFFAMRNDLTLSTRRKT